MIEHFLENNNEEKKQNNNQPQTELPEDIIEFENIKTTSFEKLIKVIGVGGGGSNAVTNMFKEGITDVSFIICNTDRQALERSPVPIKIQLGKELTKGLGAGNDPKMGRESAKESLKDLEKILRDGTQMVFITAGMGGGTGTGAAPIIANLAKSLDILTIGIVTLPFRFEGFKRLKQAVEGIQELKKNVDALLLIDNERIKDVYGDFPADEAFRKADQILTIAAKGIAEIITVGGEINVDFADVRNVLKDSGIAIMGTGYGEGENRAIDAISKAIHSPLLNFQEIKGANKLLFNIAYHQESKLLTNEIDTIAKYIQEETQNIPDTIWGYSINSNIKPGQISVTVIATGFKSSIDDYLNHMLKEFAKMSENFVNTNIPTETINKPKEKETTGPLFENVEPEIKEKEISFNGTYNTEEEMIDIIENLPQMPMTYNSLEDIKKLEKEPAYIRFGYKVVTKSTGRDKPKIIILTQNPLN